MPPSCIRVIAEIENPSALMSQDYILRLIEQVTHRLASAWVLPDEQSFSSGPGDAAAEPGYRDEMAAGHLHPAI